MKNIILLLLSLYTYNLQAQISEDDIAKHKAIWLAQKVKTVSINGKKKIAIDYEKYQITEYSYSDNRVYNYDKNWKLQFIAEREKRYGKRLGRDTMYFEYNSKGQLTRKYRKLFKRDGLYSIHYYYDEDNRLDTIVNHLMHLEQAYQYHKLSDEEFFNTFASMPHIETLQYNGSEVISKRYWAVWIDGVFGDSSSYIKIQTYDKDGYLIKKYEPDYNQIEYSKTDYITTRFFYKKGHLTKRKIKYISTHVNINRITEKIKYNSEGLIKSITSWTFLKLKYGGGIYRDKEKFTYEYLDK